MPIQFYFTDTTVLLLERKRLKLFIKSIFDKKERQLNSLTIIFCSDEYLLDINKQFLQHDYYTDIITFNLSEDIKVIEGEIYISVDRVRDNAISNKVTVKQELHRVLFHGVLHLCGYLDKSVKAKKEMTLQENYSLERYFSSDLY